MKNLLLILLVVGAVYLGYGEINGAPPLSSGSASEAADVSSPDQFSGPAGFDEQDAGRQVQGSGVVKKVLPDDNEGSRHQRFLLSLRSGQTILIAHNIDLAPRLGSLEVGDSVSFYGVYESNERGGVVHWTHRDPAGRHIDGWLKHSGKTFQ